jgi:calpain-15
MGCANSRPEERFLTLENFEDPRKFAMGGQSAAAKQKKAHICEGNVKDKYKKLFRHQEIIKDLGAQGGKFTDDEFAPDASLLNKTGNAPASFSKFVFKRATDFMDPKEIAVFRGIDPNDISQGALGDCYLLCCLATLAERPKLVERLIITEQFNQVGCYAIWLCDAGTWRSVIVDDYFPCNPKTGLPAFTKSNGPELWVLLLEKAYAKLFGGYDVIEGGLPQYALKDLTGAPYESKESSDPDVMWDFIKKSDEKNYLLTCYSKSTEIREQKNPLGIVSGHAYSILDAKEILDKNGSISDRIVQIRNPWGKFEWTGAWGDKSSKWTPEAKAQVPTYADADDGTFWMSITDFVTFYEGVGICKLHEDYFYQSVKLRHDESTLANFRSKDDAFIPYENPNRTVVRIRVEKKSHLFLSVNQTDDRKFMVSGLPYSYSNVRMFVSKVTPEGLRYEAGVSQADRDVVIETTLGKGDYLVSIEVVWEQEHHKRFTFSAYSENAVHLERVGAPDYDLLERNVLKSFAVKNSASKVKDYGSIGEPNIKRYMGSAYDLVYFYYNNQGNAPLKETVFMNGRSNLRACLPFTNNNQFEVTVPPKSDAIVIFKTVVLNEGFAFSLKSDFKVAHLGGLASMVMVPAYSKTLYYDNPEDVVNDHHDLDCYNEFIKDDKDIYVSVNEVKAEAPAAEEEDKEIVVEVLAQVRGQLVDEDDNKF